MDSKAQPQTEHEAFKNRLVDDVFGAGASDKVPMEKVVMLLWQFRDEPSVITFMARFVAKYAGSRHVFDGIEFYLPQLAHMIIHLEVDWDDAVLERFALVIAQQSLHFALQFNWILRGALDDYQPELPDEEGSAPATPNPNYNPVFYTRCLKLLRNVERCVVYGKPRAAELQKLYEQGKITQAELVLLEQADRRFNALQITAADDSEVDGANHVQLDGWVEIQTPVPKGSEMSGEFVQRFCSLDKHVLNCYKSPGGGCAAGELQLERALSLERANVASDPKAKLTLQIRTQTYQFRLRFSKEEESKLWKRRMSEEADTTSLFQQSLDKSRRLSTDNTVDNGKESQEGHHKGEADLKDDLTPDQLGRYEFFHNERIFVDALTELAEELRFLEPTDRKKVAPTKAAKLEIPPAVYLPLCNSSNIWRRVAFSVPNETRVFNTKERCPVILHFVSKRGEYYKPTGIETLIKTDPNLDVAEYMHNYFEVGISQVDVMEGVAEETEEEVTEKDHADTLQENDLHGSQHGGRRPNIWQEEEDPEADGPPRVVETGNNPSSPNRVGGNRRVQRLLREHVVVLPSKLAKRLGKNGPKGKRLSVMDRQTEMQASVPILAGNEQDAASVGGGSVVSVERSSILMRDKIVLGDLDEGDIDSESINRAKKYVCGGHNWAEKSAQMLEKAMKDANEKEGATPEDDTVQAEITSCMSKSNDDLRQEVFVMQMIHYYKSVFAKADLPLWLKTYRILSTGSSTGLLEVLTDATSLDGLKKSDGYPEKGGLRAYFELVYGGPDSESFQAAQTNFMQSLAGYAIVSYLLGLKDRHNGNIMIDTRGHLVFIDFGFAMGMAPGHEFSMERAPFKLTKEFVQVMGGVGSECYKEFQRLFAAGMQEARKNSQIALGLVEIMMYKSNYPCFSGWRYGKGRALARFEKRLLLKVPEKKVKRRALRLIRQSRQHFGTYLYDVFQKATNGYAI